MEVQQQTKTWRKEDVQALLARTDLVGKKAVVNAIKGLYARQTASEQADRTTRVHNGRGFNSRDAKFLSDIAQKLPKYHDNMTDKQLWVARKMLRKYWRQLLEIIEEKGGVVEYPAPTRKTEIANSAPAEAAVEEEEEEEDRVIGSWGIF